MQRRSLALVVAFGLLSSALATPVVGAAGPTKCQVSNDRTRVGAGSLQAAVNAAAPGDTITIRGTCIGSTTIDRSLTLKGGRTNPAFGTPTLDGGGVGRVLFVDYLDPSRAGFTLTIESLTITNGFGEDGNGGGGLLVEGGTVVIKDSIITKNSSGVLGGGGIQAGGSTLSLDGTTVSENTAGDRGGGIWATGSVTIVDSTISNNTLSTGAGGGLGVGPGNVTIRRTTLSDNRAVAGGGVNSYGAIVTLDTVTVVGNHAQSGAGIYNWGPGYQPLGSMTIVDSRVNDNVGSPSTGEGGGIANRGVLTVSDSTIHGNSSRFGGGISNYLGTVLVENSTISSNTASSSGGGIGGGGAFTLRGTLVSGNTATVNGGGIIVAGSVIDQPSDMTISHSTITDNTAANGGGVANFGNLTFTVPTSVVGDNAATTRGGGVFQGSTYPVVPTITGACPVTKGGNVIYDPANTPTDYVGFACLDQANEYPTYATAMSPLSSYAAQTFTAGVTGSLDYIELFLDLPGSLYTNVANVRIESVVGGIPTGTVLATAAPLTLTTSFWIEFSFDTPVTVSQGTTYAIVLVAPTPAWAISALNPYPAGQAVMNGAAYPTDDFAFRTYVRPH